MEEHILPACSEHCGVHHRGCGHCWARQEGQGVPVVPLREPWGWHRGHRVSTQHQFLEEGTWRPWCHTALGHVCLQGSMGKAFEALWDDTLQSPRAATAAQLSPSQHPSPWHPSPMPPPAGPDHPPRNPPLAPPLLTTPRAPPRSPPCLCSTLSHQVSLAGAPQGHWGSDK